MPLRLEQRDEDVLLFIKAVPGASRDIIAGLVGDRLKIRIASPPEDGKANKAIIKLLAKALDRKLVQITIEFGATNPEKTIRITNARVDEIAQRLTTHDS